MSEAEAAKLRANKKNLFAQLKALLLKTSRTLQKDEQEIAQAFALNDTKLKTLANTLSSHKDGETNLVVSFGVEEKQTTVLVFAPSGITNFQIPATKAELEQQTAALRVNLQKKDDSYRQPAQALHKHLIAPLLAHFEKNHLQPKTLTLYLSGRLRQLPFAALLDAKGQFLTEKYRLSTYLAAADRNADKDPLPQWGVTAFGSTLGGKGGTLLPLPGVKQELRNIVRTAETPAGILPGKLLLDPAFTRSALEAVQGSKAARGQRGVLHVATHFTLVPGQYMDSHLLLGDDTHFSVAELYRGLDTDLSDIDLVTLSACNSMLAEKSAPAAAGDGKDFEGLGAAFQSRGARAVLGSLWPVADGGTAEWMQQFYQARGERRAMSKAAAVQQVQLDFLRGKVTVRNPQDGKAIDVRHPYYWAPFVLMGNWL